MKFSLPGADRLARRLSPDALRAVLKLWVLRYSAQIRREFAQNSRGGGAWRDLAESTKRARSRKAAARVQIEGGSAKRTRGARRFAILRDTGLLYNALTVGAGGNLVEYGSAEVKFGFAPVRHGSDRVTIQAIAAAHDVGGGRLPKRQILNEPTSQTRDAMMGDLRRHVGG